MINLNHDLNDDFVEAIDLSTTIPKEESTFLGFSIKIPSVDTSPEEFERLFEKRRMIHQQGEAIQATLSEELLGVMRNKKLSRQDSQILSPPVETVLKAPEVRRTETEKPPHLSRTSSSPRMESLGKPRELTIVKEMASYPNAKWPTTRRSEYHIEHIKSNREIVDCFSTADTKTTSANTQPNKRSNYESKIVYESKSRQAPYYLPISSTDTTLLFESRFEGGNLMQVTQVEKYEYNLKLSPDMRTSGHQNWYYFRVKNVRKGITYKLRIINMRKKNSLYTKGMRPLVYSEKMAKEKGTNIY